MNREYRYRYYCACGKGLRLKSTWADGVCEGCKESNRRQAAKELRKKRREERRKPKQVKQRPLVTCLVCETVFEARPASQRKTCSDVCRSIAVVRSANRAAKIGAQANREKAKKRRLEGRSCKLRANKGLCICCSAVLERRTGKFCVNCRPFINSLVQRLSRLRRVKVCEICGQSFTNAQSQSSKYCSNACYKQTPEKRQLIKSSRAKRRAKVHSVTIEPVNPRSVFIRDGWCCVYCGTTVREYAANGWLAGDEATLDHVKPLSLGGEHAYSNLVTACCQCNSKKGAKYFVE
jgi:5-methylcytosine-specific restriction endonuclease McrA